MGEPKQETYDVYFGVGGRLNDRRALNPFYKKLLEDHAMEYGEIPAKASDLKRSYVEENIINAILRKGGRFFLNNGKQANMDDKEVVTTTIMQALRSTKKKLSSGKEKGKDDVSLLCRVCNQVNFLSIFCVTSPSHQQRKCRSKKGTAKTEGGKRLETERSERARTGGGPHLPNFWTRTLGKERSRRWRNL